MLLLRCPFRLAALLAISAMGCGGSSTEPDPMARPGPPASLRLTKGMPASLEVGMTDTIKVQVVDLHGTPIPGVRVSFSVEGTSLVQPALVLTDSNGIAATAWTVATNVYESCELRVTVSHSGSPILLLTLQTSITPGPSVRGTFDEKYHFVKVGDATPVSMVLYDVYGNIVAPSTPNLRSRDPTVARIDALGRIEGVDMGQTFVVAESPNGVLDSTVVVVMPPMGIVGTNLTQFEYTANAPLYMTVIAYPTYPANQPIGSATIHVTWDPSVLTYLPPASLPENPNLVVNASEANEGRLTFSFVSVNGTSGATPLLSLVFQTSRAGQHAIISTEVVEMTTARTFQDMTAHSYGFSQFFRLR